MKTEQIKFKSSSGFSLLETNKEYAKSFQRTKEICQIDDSDMKRSSMNSKVFFAYQTRATETMEEYFTKNFYQKTDTEENGKNLIAQYRTNTMTFSNLDDDVVRSQKEHIMESVDNSYRQIGVFFKKSRFLGNLFQEYERLQRKIDLLIMKNATDLNDLDKANSDPKQTPLDVFKSIPNNENPNSGTKLNLDSERKFQSKRGIHLEKESHINNILKSDSLFNRENNLNSQIELHTKNIVDSDLISNRNKNLDTKKKSHINGIVESNLLSYRKNNMDSQKEVHKINVIESDLTFNRNANPNKFVNETDDLVSKVHYETYQTRISRALSKFDTFISSFADKSHQNELSTLESRVKYMELVFCLNCDIRVDLMFHFELYLKSMQETLSKLSAKDNIKEIKAIEYSKPENSSGQSEKTEQSELQIEKFNNFFHDLSMNHETKIIRKESNTSDTCSQMYVSNEFCELFKNEIHKNFQNEDQKLFTSFMSVFTDCQKIQAENLLLGLEIDQNGFLKILQILNKKKGKDEEWSVFFHHERHQDLFLQIFLYLLRNPENLGSMEPDYYEIAQLVYILGKALLMSHEISSEDIEAFEMKHETEKTTKILSTHLQNLNRTFAKRKAAFEATGLMIDNISKL